jgi:hypothetical protein
MTQLERRAFTLDKIAITRADDKPKIVGHAAVFNTETDIGGYFREKVAPGAFRDAIGRDDVRALFNHDPNFVLGRNKSGTLRMAEDDVGLAVEIDPPDTQIARDLLVSMERGDISQMSFGFMVRKQQWEEDDKGVVTRTLIEVELFDVSPVTYPAYPTTDVGVRMMQEYKQRTFTLPNLGFLRRKLIFARDF